MANSELVKYLKTKFPQFKQKEISDLIKLFFDEIKDALKRGQTSEFRDFFIIKPKKLKENKSARNPKTGELIYVPERKSVKFKMSKKLFKDLNAK